MRLSKRTGSLIVVIACLCAAVFSLPVVVAGISAGVTNAEAAKHGRPKIYPVDTLKPTRRGFDFDKTLAGSAIDFVRRHTDIESAEEARKLTNDHKDQEVKSDEEVAHETQKGLMTLYPPGTEAREFVADMKRVGAYCGTFRDLEKHNEDQYFCLYNYKVPMPRYVQKQQRADFEKLSEEEKRKFGDISAYLIYVVGWNIRIFVDGGKITDLQVAFGSVY